MRIETNNSMDIDLKAPQIVKKEAHQQKATVEEPLKRIQEEQKKIVRGEQNINEAVEKLNKTLDLFDIQVRFKIHKETKDIMIKVVDMKNNKVIREIPPEKILDMVAKMMEFLGLLFDEKV
ncbi:MAG: flagellar protein FlaG [Synergistetes bacterium]|nr:flagellar protein FlaG [Synergistota bacterium]